MHGPAARREGWLTVEDAGYRIYYSLAGSAGETLIVLNGGPGVGQRYLRRLEELADDHLQVVFYDQLGSGQSDAPDASYEWTVARFSDELEAVRRPRTRAPLRPVVGRLPSVAVQPGAPRDYLAVIRDFLARKSIR